MACALILTFGIETLYPETRRPELILGGNLQYPSPWPQEWGADLVVLQDPKDYRRWILVTDEEIDSGSPNMSGVVSLDIQLSYHDYKQLPGLPKIPFRYKSIVKLSYSGGLRQAGGAETEVVDVDLPGELAAIAQRAFCAGTPRLRQLNISRTDSFPDNVMWQSWRFVVVQYAQLCLLVTFPIALFSWLVLVVVKKMRKSVHACSACDYSLQGLPSQTSVCPECGQIKAKSL